ncbi:MAG: hypothetical protein NDF52_06310 [archaeon YNP-WB-062]|nr:hypothetical protein [Candidatus Culexarchaeum yellowstonense]
MGYGVFGLVYGIAWTVGASIYSCTIALSTSLASIYAIAMQTISILLITQL